MNKVSTFGKDIGNSNLSARCSVLFNDNDEAIQYQCYIFNKASQECTEATVFECHDCAIAWMDNMTAK